ncbi:DUF4832 domain-containing protein [Paenibacillus cremeus]|uniref:DUF4832 domain-containing protein n=1 Tax=Paenibacillus cremeus TaxID=2163881 RepID=A0A559KAX5_9BACL|nr:DUF4832 domain-containing protein [Paenibacillus cremeus]TVY09249.1 DUF4832 domain-containing protein [Paenibacillus cremeus]
MHSSFRRIVQGILIGWGVLLGSAAAYADEAQTDSLSEDFTLAYQGNAYTADDGSKLFSIADGKKLYVLFEGQDLNTQNAIYIDSDNNSQTGYASPAWASSGIDYKVEDHQLFKYSSSAGWSKVGPVRLEVFPNALGMIVYLDMLGKALPGEMKVSFVSKSQAYPADGLGMMTMNTIVQSNEPQGTFYPREDFSVFANPYMGWVGSGYNKTYGQPVSMVSIGLSWRELEPVKGQYNWDAIERSRNFSYWERSGKKIVMRIVLDYPSDRTGRHMDIPDWLYDELVQAEGADQAGTWYAQGLQGFDPNYSSPIMIAAHERLIEALAARYDNDPTIGFIELGSLGHWGEFHTFLSPRKFPSLDVSDQYVGHYLKYFHNKMFGMRKPFPIAAQQRMGLFNDVFGDPVSTDSWLDWIQQGWNVLPNYVTDGRDTAALVQESAMPDFWKYAFSGGEFSNEFSMKEYLQDSRMMELLRQIRKSHTSLLGASLVYFKEGKDISEHTQANINLLLQTMGYHFGLASVTHAPQAEAGDTVKLESSWKNMGVAPFYFPWQVEFALADSNGNVVDASRTTASSIDIRRWLPGTKAETGEIKVPSDLPPGQYTVLVGIIEPSTNKPAVQLAIEGRRSDGWYALDQLQITNSAAYAPTSPNRYEVQHMSDKRVDLTWAPSFSSSKISHYEVYLDQARVGTTNMTSYAFTNLAEQTKHTFAVVAVDSNGRRSVGTPFTFVTDGRNLIENAGFESYTRTNGGADGWSLDGSEFAVTDTDVVQGKRAQRMRLSKLGSDHFVEFFQTIPVVGGRSYIFEGSYHITELFNAKLEHYLYFTDAENNWISSAAQTLMAVTPGFTPVRSSGVIPPNAAKVHVGVILRATQDNGTGTVVADELNYRYYQP